MTERVWTDEQISAFLDGELNSADTEALARAVETDAAIAARVERLGAATRAYVSAVSEIDRRPVSDGVKAILATPPSAKVIPFRAKTLVASASAFVMEHRAIAAGLIVAAGVWGVSANLAGPGPDLLAPGPDGVIVASSPVGKALENGRSGEVVQVASNATVTPRLTFASADGGFCRQYDVASSAGTTSAVACRDNGKWRNEIAVFGKPNSTTDYQTASGDKSPALEAFIDQHIAGAPLGASEEAALLSKSWTK